MDWETGGGNRRVTMKKLEWINGNKARIETGHKTFDRQCESVMCGQLLGTCQFSWCIRPVDEVECNGRHFDRGHLRQFDLKGFGNLPYPTHRCLDAITVPVILYKFRHWGKLIGRNLHQEVVDGYVITTYGEEHRVLHTFAYRAKGYQIIDWVLPYISDQKEAHSAAA